MESVQERSRDTLVAVTLVVGAPARGETDLCTGRSKHGTIQVCSGLGDGHALLEIQSGDYEGGVPAFTHRYYHAPLEAIGQMREPTVVYASGDLPGMPQWYGVSSTTAALILQPGGTVAVFEGSETRLRGGPDDPVTEGAAQRAILIGRDVYWDDYAYTGTPGEWRIRQARAGFDRASEYYFEPADGELQTMRTDGRDWVWVQNYGPREVDTRHWARSELWTAPVEDDPADLAPRLIAVGEFPDEPRVGDGMAALFIAYTASDPVGLVDLDTGRMRRFPPPPGWGFHALLSVSRESAFFGIHQPGGPYTVVQVDPRALPYDAVGAP